MKKITQPKKSKQIRKFNIMKLSRNKLIILSIGIFASISFLALKYSKAASYDGYQRLRIVNTAINEIGNSEWNARVLSYSEGNKENWCADFVSWVYLAAGYPFVSESYAGKSSWRIPSVYQSGASSLRGYLQSKGAYKVKESGYQPVPGDIVIFSRAGRSHTGIVEKFVPGSKSSPDGFVTIEGNTSTQNVARRMYTMGEPTLDGFGTIINSPPPK